MARITTCDQGTVPCDQQILFVILPSKYKKLEIIWKLVLNLVPLRSNKDY